MSQAACSASRASLLTGSYANRIGIHGVLGPGNSYEIHEDEVTFGELFQSQAMLRQHIGNGTLAIIHNNAGRT